MPINMKRILYTLLMILPAGLPAQNWVPDLGNGRFRNPVIFADYSDPDVIRVGNDFYLVSSSFNCMPGIPVLHSNDLVNWSIINHVYKRLPLEKYDKPDHGSGSWAPAIRVHDQTFYVYFCTPHDGLFMANTKNPEGEWALHHVEKVELWEDPCPFWDDDGNAYLVRGKLCGNELYLHRLSQDGGKLLDNGTLIYKDRSQPTIEGPKFMKKDGYYYILSPAGGVPEGWQTVLRSRDIYGPYEARIVMHQGNTAVNGPHQGGLVELASGEWWFMHFQDRGPYGRIVHLQPVSWKDGWPMIGVDRNGDGIGEPVMEYNKPDVGKQYPVEVPQTSDEFNGPVLGLQWQWHANPRSAWYSLKEHAGILRLYSVKNLTQGGNLWFVPNLLLQKFPMPAFTVTTRLDGSHLQEGDRCGLVIMGRDWGYLAISRSDGQFRLGMYEGTSGHCDDPTVNIESVNIPSGMCYLRVFVNANGICQFSYSGDNGTYSYLGREFSSAAGVWIGAKVGLFCMHSNITESEGFAEVDWFRVTE